MTPDANHTIVVTMTATTSVRPTDHGSDRAGTQSVIAARGVRKAYDGRPVLEGVDLVVAPGELVALLGPNGAGKTTLVEILEGQRRADDGEIRVLGHDPARRERALRARIGIVFQANGIDPGITAGESLDLYGAAFPQRLEAAEALRLVGLEDHADARVERLSGGQRRRLDLALGLVGRPDVLFLDEPTTGFDPAARRESWDLIAGLRNAGMSILLTTHYLDEAAALADRVVVLMGGRVIKEGTPHQLNAGGDALVSFLAPPGLTLPANADLAPTARRVTIRTATPTLELAPLISWAAARGVELDQLSVARPDLEDAYLALTQEQP